MSQGWTKLTKPSPTFMTGVTLGIDCPMQGAVNTALCRLLVQRMGIAHALGMDLASTPKSREKLKLLLPIPPEQCRSKAALS